MKEMKKETRLKVYRMYDGHCAYCGRTIEYKDCNFRKRDMTLEQFRAEIKRQAVGLLSGAAKFQMKMSIAYGLIIPQFDKKVVFYFEKVKRKD